MAGVFEAIAGNTAEIGRAKETLSAIHEKTNETMDSVVQAISAGTVRNSRGQATTIPAEAQELAAQLSAQTAIQQRAETIDYEKTSNELLQKTLEQVKIRDQKLGEVQAINDSSNPLVHIAGLFTAPFKMAEAQVAEERAKGAAEGLNQINLLMQSSARTSAEIQTRVTEQTNASVLGALANDQAAEAGKAKLMALSTNADQITKILGLSKDQLNNTIKGFEIGEAMEMRELRKEQMRQMAELRKKAASEDNAREQSVDFINLALVNSGMDPIPDAQRAFIADQLNKPGATGEMFRELMQKGFIGAQSGTFTQGDTPVEALGFRNKVGYQPATPTEAETVSTIDGIIAGDKTVNEAKSMQDKVNAANQAVKSKLLSDQENVNTAKDSLAKPASWSSLATSAALKENRLFQEHILPTITPDISLNAIEPVDLFKRATTLVAGKKGTIEEGVALMKEYAALSVHLNNSATGLTKLTGLRQSAFKANLPQTRTQFTALDINFPGTSTPFPPFQGAFAGVTAGVNSVLASMPPVKVKIDFLKDAELFNAFANQISGELRKPEASESK